MARWPSTASGPWPGPALVTLPLGGLSILLAAPGADVRWENHPSHFWLVLGTPVGLLVAALLAALTGSVWIFGSPE